MFVCVFDLFTIDAKPKTQQHQKKIDMRYISIVLVLLVLVHHAPAEKKAKKKIKAVSPEVQTAKWAQKWWMPRHKDKLAALKKNKQAQLVMIGDSITHGWEGRGRKVWAQYYAKRKAFNLGFSGDRTEQVLWRLDHGAVKGLNPKLVVVMIGTNNAGHRREKSQYTAAGIKAIIANLRKRLPKSKILLLAIFPRGKNKGDQLRKLNDATNKTIASYADNKTVHYLDINSTFLNDKGELPKSVMPDLLHPNEKGYGMWAKAMEPTIKRLMGE